MSKNLFEGIRKLMDTIAKGVSKVLVVGWLWIPFSYSLIFFLILLVNGQEFPPYSEIFLIGFFICLATSVLLFVIKGPNIKKAPKQEFSPQPLISQQIAPTPAPQYNNTINNNQYTIAQEAKSQLLPQYQPAPLVFASRVDPNLYIHEYNDKLIFYKRENGGMLYLGTEYKKNAS
ncbi:MAG: hypothetical protein FWF56_01030 [Firmicutes bacterium]|nr:hypothetical protein [Bacillota bacterium]MCL1954253.1 hypothetical protein [Bacillota bacterium]